jgi:cytochrome c-type biogenesis protein CcmH
MRALPIALLVLAQLAVGSLASAAEAVPTELDRVQQRRAVELSEHLRCLVCQNQTIADSNADLAQDLRRQVREQISQGRTDAEIVAFMVQRYGDFVLYKPPVKATTLLLWFGPAMLLLAGIVVLVRNLRGRSKVAGPPELTGEERVRAASLLDGGIGKDGA